MSTIKELKAKLDELQVEYKPQAPKPELEALLDAHTPMTDSEVEAVEVEAVEAPVEAPEATPEVEAEEVEPTPENSVTLEFGALMLATVKHDGVLFEAGEGVDLEDQETFDHFKAKGWIA